MRGWMQGEMNMLLSRQISAVSDLCCIVSQRLVEAVGKVFDSVISSAMAVI